MITLRERKTAENKQAILNALFERIKLEDFDDIKISDLCVDSSISQASFYNYFPQKSDLLFYFIQLWSVEINWLIMKQNQLKGLKAIELVFEKTADATKKHPEIMAEIVSHQARFKSPTKLPKLSTADKIIAFPNLTGIDEIQSIGLESILIPHINWAIKNGELPSGTPVEIIAYSLRSIFFGIPMLLRHSMVDKINITYKEQLKIIWAGVKTQYSDKQK